jgi:hypothetical protein
MAVCQEWKEQGLKKTSKKAWKIVSHNKLDFFDFPLVKK